MSVSELDDVPWGTGMPVMLRLGSQIVSIRVRGVCSVIVSNPARFAEEVGEASALRARIGPVLSNRLIDALGETSIGKASVAELAAAGAEIAAAVKAQAGPDLEALGLVIQQLTVQAIEEIQG